MRWCRPSSPRARRGRFAPSTAPGRSAADPLTDQRSTPLPRLVAESVRIAWRAGWRELTLMLAMQLVTVAGVVVSALIVRSLLADLLDADRTGGDVGGLVPEVLGLAGLSAVLGVAHAVQLHRQRILTELCTRYGEDRVLAVTGTGERGAVDDPRFHDAVERALMAVRRLPIVINGLAALLRAAAGALGAVVALIALAPLFAPVVLLVAAPLWLAARRRSR